MPALPYTARGNALGHGNDVASDRHICRTAGAWERRLLRDATCVIGDITSLSSFNTPMFYFEELSRLPARRQSIRHLELTFNLSETRNICIRHFLKGLYWKVMTIGQLNWPVQILINLWTNNYSALYHNCVISSLSWIFLLIDLYSLIML